MVFQGEDTPLSENILKEKLDFVKDWPQWASERREIVIKHQQRQSTTSKGTVYTVPAKHTFFFTGFNFHARIITLGAAADTSSTLRLSVPSVILAAIGSNRAAYEHGELSQDFAMPIKMEESTSITLQNTSTALNSEATIMGFLVPKRLN